MLNVFPELLPYGLLAPFILRVTVGLILINLGQLTLRGERKQWETIARFLHLVPEKVFVSSYGMLQITGGVLLIAGVWTQAVAAIFSAIFLAEFAMELREEAILKRSLVFYLLLLAISVSLLFSGAGFFAFDLPL
ncbi:MAG: DoxX family membrane protein [Patescibacteria group bacterium]